MTGLRQLIEGFRELLTWWVTVTPWEQAVRVRLGRRIRLLTAGIHLRVPLADRVYRQSTRLRNSVLPAQTLTTKDGKPLTISVVLGYRIADLLRLYQTIHHGETTLQAIVMGAVGEYIVSREAKDCRPRDLCEAVVRLANLARFGLEGAELTVNSFAFVKTYRMITGDASGYTYGQDYLDTSREASEMKKE